MDLLRYTYKQKNGWTCGPAVARIVLHYHGLSIPISTLSKQLGTTRQGTDDKALIQLFKRYDISFFLKRKTDLKTLRHLLKHQIIVTSYWIPTHKEGHYSIVKSIDRKRIYFHDTWYGTNHSYTLKYFLKYCWPDNSFNWLLAIPK